MGALQIYIDDDDDDDDAVQCFPMRSDAVIRLTTKGNVWSFHDQLCREKRAVIRCRFVIFTFLAAMLCTNSY